MTGPNHSPTQLHGFLAYLLRCCVTHTPYTVYGYQGKQVRDNIHSDDLVRAFEAFFHAPRCGEVYNIGGGRESHCSMLEAIDICERVSGHLLQWTYREQNRVGDHMWWVSDLARFRGHYPDWQITRNVETIVREILAYNAHRWLKERLHAG